MPSVRVLLFRAAEEHLLNNAIPHQPALPHTQLKLHSVHQQSAYIYHLRMIG